MISKGLRLVMVLVSLFSANRARAEDGYFLMVFSYQRPVNVPRYSHSFATFIRIRADSSSSNRYAPEAFTISWLPRSLKIECLRPTPVPGQNLDLHSTLKLARQLDTCVSVWGPYRIQPQLYARAMRQKSLLESGAIGYKAAPTALTPGSCCNCVQAISDIVWEKHRLPLTKCRWGEWASECLVYEFVPWIIERDHTHDWLLTELGLGRYGICHRELTFP